MSASIRFKLSFMMFLEFFIWGAWFVTLGTFLIQNLQAEPFQISNVFSTQSLGAIIAPFIIGMVADRYFNAERILAILHLLGALLMFQMYKAPDIAAFYPYVLAYMILYMPTLALVNSVSFRQLTNPESQFSSIRVWGTVGWIIAGLAISFLFRWDSPEGAQTGALRNTFLMACIASVVLGLFAFTLPKTPPIKVNSAEKSSFSSIIGLDAVKLLKDRNFLIFFISSVLICIPLAFYYSNANPFLVEIGLSNATGKMAIGQVSEALFLLLLPVLFVRVGFKRTILLGMLAWVLRYVLFAYGNADDLSFMLIIGIALHGVCYDFFFVSGQIYTDSKAGVKYKSAAQGLITLATYGLGQLIGFWVAGYVGDKYQHIKETDVAAFWQQTWVVPAGIAFVVMVLFVILFKNEKIETKTV